MIFDNCKHQYGEVKDGYQYCNKCGAAVAAPVRECEHSWETINQADSSMVWGNVYKITYIQRCTRCGIIHTVEIK